jgi:thiol-disulfide isomerase/thioredoxin
MHKIIIALGLAIIAMVLIRVYRRAKLYGFDDFEGFSSHGKELLIVKAGWCGHCKSAMPEFQKLVKASPVKLKDGSSVTIRMLDEKENKGEVESLSVRGFPTILYRAGGKSMEYSGERTYDGVMGFLQSM